jgi:3-hydroxyisobutyrate dehydrogenase-like beta-hydroxyacid dehydrogenase
MQPFLDAGAAGVASPAEAAADADVVVTSLMDDQSVLDTVEGGTESSRDCAAERSTSARPRSPRAARARSRP